ncbi:MAG: tRNA (adenosine(37)-N6)-threonylcarbamoyltransferase complex dimerization subunit type 1 TsaB [Verrucomicrobiales bacterium]|jgi:tRNA threonylcarbamoyl adenosine modification protein YeaZ|nr:tRNA (adenosine(37)-N6)-threonylcarbamoyltransferase complex dimerization subunit type 1 TsaB [Verrucomicrobiales bacterium]
MNKFLVIETSAEPASWALFADGERIAGATVSGRASGGLAPGLRAVSGALRDAAAIIVGVGPGSFSGIRVGIATAQGLAAALGSRVIPMRSTRALAWRHRAEPDLGIFADARRGKFFHTAYAGGELVAPTRLVADDELRRLAARHRLSVSVGPLPFAMRAEAPSAADLGRAFLRFPAEPGLALEPIYLHDATPGGPPTRR